MNEAISLIYPATISEDDDGFVVSFRDLDNVFTEGDTYEEAIFNAQEVIDILLLDMVEDNIEIPQPTACRKDEVPVTVSPEVAVPILLHKLREQKHYSLADVARSIGVKYQTYQQIEAGKNITLRSLKKAAAALGATVEIKLHVHHAI